MLPKSTDQCLTTEPASNPVVLNTPAFPRWNADYSPGTAVALVVHIKRHIFDENLLTMEPRFTEIFLNKAPPLDCVRAMDLETSLGFTFKELVAQISNASVEKDMYTPIAHLFSTLTLLVDVCLFHQINYGWPLKFQPALHWQHPMIIQATWVIWVCGRRWIWSQENSVCGTGVH